MRRPRASAASCVHPRGWLAAALLGLSLGAAGCAPAPQREGGGGGARFRGPIVVVTLSALRADAVAREPSATPRFDAFAAAATWSGRAIATSSWCAGSLGSVFTGLPPALHGAGHPAHPWLRPAVRTLAEELTAAGFAAHGFYATPWVGPGFGMERGFAALRPLRRRAAERYLGALEGGPSFTWIQLPLPGLATAEAPGDRAARRARARRGSPPSVVAVSHAPTEPRPPTAGGDKDDGDDGEDYEARVREGDRRLGRVLDELRRSERYDEAIVVVLADHGDGAGGAGGATSSEDIERSSVEVPLAVKLPASLASRLRTPLDRPVGLDRIFATVVELSGGRPVPAAAPSLLRAVEWPAVSELWFADGFHEIGLYQDGHRLRWRCRFAETDLGFARARREALAGAGSVAFGEEVERLESIWRRRPACTLGEDVVLEAWPRAGGVVRVEDGARAARMIDRLRALRSFPPPWSVQAPHAPPVLRRRDLRALAAWGLPVPAQWAQP